MGADIREIVRDIESIRRLIATLRTNSLGDEGMPERICDNCSLDVADLPHTHWREKNFTLCDTCIYWMNYRNKKENPEHVGRAKKKHISDALRWEIFERDRFTCQYCSAQRFLAVDHIIPESRGGTLDTGNLVTACKDCNTLKGARTPEEAGMSLIKKSGG